MEKTRVGRLYGGDDRVLESVVTYLVSAMKRGLMIPYLKIHDCAERGFIGRLHTSVVLPAP